MITVSFAYLLGLVFQTLVLMPLETIERLISDKVWAGFVALMSLPLDQSLTDVIFASGEQSLIVSIMIVFIFIGIISLFGALVEIKWQENRSREIHNRAELAALKAQIEPHFLFNSLNTIAAYIQENPPEAEKLTLQLSKIMQYMTYSANRELVDLKEEIEFTRNYINMLEIRFKELLIVKWSTDYSSPAVQVPVLIMQPLIENSIRHGWVDRNRKLQITIRITENKPFIIIEVKDNGLGVRPELLKKLPKPGHALANIAERMQLIFGKPDLLTISSVFHKETIVKLKIPR